MICACKCGSGGALEREKELLKQIECLTREMTEALKATDAAKQLTAKAEAASAKMRETLEEERSEAVRQLVPCVRLCCRAFASSRCQHCRWRPLHLLARERPVGCLREPLPHARPAL